MLLPYDEVTFVDKVELFCIDCGSPKIEKDEDQPPFHASDKKICVVIPLKCKACGYSFSLFIEAKGE